VRYQVINPLTLAVMPKESHVLPLDEQPSAAASTAATSVEGSQPQRAAAWSRRDESAVTDAVS